MKQVTIIGAGQAGLVLAIGLLRKNYQVRLIQDRTADEISKGRILSGQVLFGPAQAVESQVCGPTFQAMAPQIAGINLTFPMGGGECTDLVGHFSANAEAIDQRLKFPELINRFVDQGGCLVIENVGMAELERYHQESDLLVVCTGKGPLANLFPKEEKYSPFEGPSRFNSLVFFRPKFPVPDAGLIRTIAVENAGSVMYYPGLSRAGRGIFLLFSARPNSVIDIGREHQDGEEMLSVMLAALPAFDPAAAEIFSGASLTDSRAFLYGGIHPLVRQGVGFLASGKPVVGLGDTTVLTDPIGGQGANIAIKMAVSWLHSIVENEGPYNEEWMRHCSTKAWRAVAASNAWSSLWLRQPSALLSRFMSQAAAGETANQLARGFEDPRPLIAELMRMKADQSR